MLLRGVLNFPQTLRGAPHKPGKLLSWGVYLKLYWGSSAQTRETAFLGSLPQTLLGKLRTNQGNCFLGEFTSNSTGEAPHKPGKLLSWGVYLKLYWGSSAQTRKTAFLGSLLQTLLGKLRTNQGNCFLGEVYLKFYQESSAQTPGQAEPIFTRPRVLRFRLRACAPINRQSPQRASSRLERGALWRSLAQPCARNPRNVSV